jgi:hypothetical protein
MPHEVVLGKIYAVLKEILAGSGVLATLIATKTLGGGPAIYDEGAVPQGSAMPYLTIGAGTQIPAHTMGMAHTARYGWTCTLQIKAIGQGSEAAGIAIVSTVAAVLYEGYELLIAGYGYAWVDECVVQPTIITIAAGVTTREWPLIFRVNVHD